MADSPNLEGSGLVSLTVLVNGAPLDASVALVSVRISSVINKIPTARIVLLDGDMPNKDFPVSNSDNFKPGAEITINAGYDQQEETIFKGIVVKHGLKITGNNYARLVIDCWDKAIKMTIGRNNANYVESKDSDIMTKLIGNASGLTANVSATTVQYKELVQHYCTDWDFLLSRAEVNGLLVIVEDGKVTVQAPQVSGAAQLTVTYGEDLIEFDADIDAKTQLTAVKGVSWDPKTQAIVEEEVSPQTLNAQGDLTSSQLATVVGPSSFRLQTSAPLEKTAIKAWSDGQQVKAGLARIRGRMKFQGSAKAKIGTLIELEGVGNRFNGNVFISAVHHDISEGNWTSEVEFGLPSAWFAERRDLVAPSASGLLPGVDGLQVGIVKKLDADPEGQYKIQVTVPVLQTETEGVWARLTKFYASDGIGSFFIPEIGDEVVLGYFNNDPSHPVILGSLYSSKRKPPYEPTADNFIKAIVTKSELKVEFDDDKKVITLVTPGNNTIVISDDQKSILLQDQNNNKVELSSSGIVLDSPKDISITAKGKVTIDAVGEVGITSKVDVKVTGLNVNNTANVGFVAKGNATAELSASGQTTVKGAMVMIN
ncbi:MAG: type VI secretion system tip protein VgrG [Nitrospirales bacterium]|nr:type VI secretion system tip protein VgrG [Nitrospirales bacterium]